MSEKVYNVRKMTESGDEMTDLYQELDRGTVERVLACPVCGAPLGIAGEGRGLACSGDNPKGRAHCFDAGVSGYLPLAPRHSGGGDSKEAVRARSSFLRADYYRPAAAALTQIVARYTPVGGTVLDAGCGEGYYSNHIAEAGYSVLGVDLSKFAVDAAAKAARTSRLAAGKLSSRTVFAVGSVFELPVRSASVDTVTNIFAPCAPTEYARVLRPGGYLIVAGAGERHLLDLKRLIYDDPYLNDGRSDLPKDGDAFTLVDQQTVSFTARVEGQAHVAALFSMTPYYWRTSRVGHERLSQVERLETEVSFDFFIYRLSPHLNPNCFHH